MNKVSIKFIYTDRDGKLQFLSRDHVESWQFLDVIMEVLGDRSNDVKWMLICDEYGEEQKYLKPNHEESFEADMSQGTTFIDESVHMLDAIVTGELDVYGLLKDPKEAHRVMQAVRLVKRFIDWAEREHIVSKQEYGCGCGCGY